MADIIFSSVLEKTFRDAADHIERVGWFRGHYFENNEHVVWEDPIPRESRCCVLGSILASNQSENVVTLRQSYQSHYFSAAGLFLNEKVPNIVRWNDEPSTTKEDVVTLLRQAADDVKYNNSNWLAFQAKNTAHWDVRNG